MIGVFDSDKKSRARVPTPKEVEEKMQPVKHLLEYSTQLATRYQFGGRIPWSRFIQRKVDRKRSARERRKAAKEREKQGLPPLPTRPVKLGVAGKLKKARTEDIQRRAALEPPVRLLSIRPHSRGERRSLRTFPVVTLHPRFPFNV
jgi:hypothetical protein